MARNEHGVEVSTAAAHILVLLDNVQEQLASIRKAAERIATQQEESDTEQREESDASHP